MSDTTEKSIKSLCIYLLKEERDTFADYIKPKYTVDSVSIKEGFALEGEIFYPDTQSSPPRWKPDVDELAASPISVSDNSSNKAVMITKIDGAILAITFGYGRSLLREEDIERNFGLKVALSIIDPKKIRSVNTATFEDMVVSSQHQASIHTSQSEFDLDTVTDIFRGVTGVPSDETYGRSVSGKDVLKVSVEMHISELKEKLELYLAAYRSNGYRKGEFGWIDNINEVRDRVLSEGLDGCIIEKMLNKQLNDIAISPPETIDWDSISGIFINGAGKELKTPAQSIDVSEYITQIRSINIAKLKRDKLMVCNDDGSEFVASSIYSSLVAHVEYEGQRYILCMGSWYLIHDAFYNKVATYVNAIERKDDLLPACAFSTEGEYNANAAENDTNFCLMDKKLFRVEETRSDIEACDLFSKSKQFIHVKFKTRSSLLSHLFAQGRVSYECFLSDVQYRQDVINRINQEFGELVIEPDGDISGFEVVYAIVTNRTGQLSEILPFFSAVTLMQSAKALSAMRVKFSVCIVPENTAD